MAITTQADGQPNGQIAVAALNASLLPEAPQIVIELWKTNLTHDLIARSGVFAVHLLPREPAEALARAVELVRRLGLRSGRDGAKLHGVAFREGATGSPILADALTFVEAHVVGQLDVGEATCFLGAIIAGDRLRAGAPLTMADLHAAFTPDDQAAWDAHNLQQRAIARQMRGLPPAGHSPA